ncbi:DUF2442 domain-containing protein [Nitrosomonas sp. JL21]|uniref:DUF2442 domain-containing protein n=1 Tax=Nitrosomonas sp. JL21 TaxID=153949 RepID=UPI00136D5155|nr:DUF2442 domain-containing protein [Nitrosomonas sp. JL21]MBL8498148.1 DUF2442 domain-containing protein [Nitrosomonas sp.]MCC7091978.1 DUF2442 domain-containing protein [Nitrosomonas sp.]MXS77270.1 DUF2442 domain-containing protein [Nitrosomonas sp. JL21]
MSTKTANQEHCASGVIAAASWRIRSATVLPDYRLSVTCNDGTTGLVDLSQLIFSENPGIFDALKDEQYFNQVRIEMGALTWSNGADLNPAWLHDEIEKNGTWCIPV